MTDLDKLEALAKHCTSGDPWYTEGDLCGRQTFDQFLSQDRAFIAAANPATILDLIASARRDAEEIERLRDEIQHLYRDDLKVRALSEADDEINRLRAKLDRYEGARISDVSDEEAGRMIKAFWATVEKWSGEEWNDQKAQRLGLMNMGLMQAMAMAAQSNAETFTYTANGVTHKGEPIGDWTVTIARAAHTGEG